MAHPAHPAGGVCTGRRGEIPVVILAGFARGELAQQLVYRDQRSVPPELGRLDDPSSFFGRETACLPELVGGQRT